MTTFIEAPSPNFDARTRPIEAELHWRAGEGRDHTRLEVDLEIDQEIEAAAREFTADVEEGTDSSFALEEDDFIDVGVALDEHRRPALQDPGEVNRRIVALQGSHHRQRVDRVADGAHHHQADPRTTRQAL